MDNPSDDRPWTECHLWQIQAVRDLFWIGLIVLIAIAVYQLRGIFIPLLIALGLAYLCMPLIDWAQQHLRFPPQVTITLLLLLTATALVSLLVWLGPLILHQVLSLAEELPTELRVLCAKLGWHWDASSISDLSAEFIEPIKAHPVETLKSVVAGSGKPLNFLESTIGTATYLVLTVAVFPVYFWCFAVRFHSLTPPLLRYIPAQPRLRTVEILTKMDRATGSYIHGRLLASTIMAIGFAVGWSPLLTNVPYWLLVSLFTGLLSLIPYGAGVGYLIAIMLKVVAISSGPNVGPWQWLVGLGGPTAVYAIVQGAEHVFMTPLVQSQATNLSIVTVILAILVGGAAGGILGMIVSIPLTACGKILLQETLLERLDAQTDDGARD